MKSRTSRDAGPFEIIKDMLCVLCNLVLHDRLSGHINVLVRPSLTHIDWLAASRSIGDLHII